MLWPHEVSIVLSGALYTSGREVAEGEEHCDGVRALINTNLLLLRTGTHTYDGWWQRLHLDEATTAVIVLCYSYSNAAVAAVGTLN